MKTNASIDSIQLSPCCTWIALFMSNSSLHIIGVSNWLHLANIRLPPSVTGRAMAWIPSLPQEVKSEHEGNKYDVPKDYTSYDIIVGGVHANLSRIQLSTGRVKYSTRSYGGAIFDIDVKDQIVACACNDGSVKIFDITPTEFVLKREMVKHPTRLLSVLFYGKSIVFAGTADSRIIRWNFLKCSSPDESLHLESKDARVWSLASVVEDDALVSGDSSGVITFWDIGTLSTISSFKHCRGELESVSYTDGMLVACGTDSSILVYRRLPNGEWLFARRRHAEVRISTIHTLGSWIVAGGDAIVRVSVDNRYPDALRDLQIFGTPTLVRKGVGCEDKKDVFFTETSAGIEVWMNAVVSKDQKSDLAKSEEHWTELGLPDIVPMKVATIEITSEDGILDWASSPDGTLVSIATPEGLFTCTVDYDTMTVTPMTSKSLQHLRPLSVLLTQQKELVFVAEHKNEFRIHKTTSLLSNPPHHKKGMSVATADIPERLGHLAMSQNVIVGNTPGGRLYKMDELLKVTQITEGVRVRRILKFQKNNILILSDSGLGILNVDEPSTFHPVSSIEDIEQHGLQPDDEVRAFVLRQLHPTIQPSTQVKRKRYGH